MSTEDFIKNTTQKGFGGSNNDINKRLDNTFNQWTGLKNDQCSYVNDMRILSKPMKYYTADIWTPKPTNNVGQYGQYSTFTSIGNQKSYGVSGNLVFPSIGEPTSLGNKKFLTYAQPFMTTPFLGSNHTNISKIDVESTHLNQGFGEATNLNDISRAETTSIDWNRWHLVDKNVVQNPNNIIFAGGVVPQAGISSRNELRNYAQMTPH
jgi:hypothetical protein